MKNVKKVKIKKSPKKVHFLKKKSRLPTDVGHFGTKNGKPWKNHENKKYCPFFLQTINKTLKKKKKSTIIIMPFLVPRCPDGGVLF